MIATSEPRTWNNTDSVVLPFRRYSTSLWLPRFPEYGPIKNVMDLIGSTLLLLAAAPVIVLAAVLIKLTSRGPAFYTQTRVGRSGRLFTIYKLRTMAHECERKSGVRWATKNDPRVTLFGWLLRASHIDELPQLWNVLVGDMSLIGPRPERPEFMPELEKALPYYRCRLLVRPGLSGLAQVQLPADSDIDSVRRKLSHDLYYVQHHTLWLDFKIVMATMVYLIKTPSQRVVAFLGLPGRETLERAYELNAAQHAPVRRAPATSKKPEFTRPAASLRLGVAR